MLSMGGVRTQQPPLVLCEFLRFLLKVKIEMSSLIMIPGHSSSRNFEPGGNNSDEYALPEKLNCAGRLEIS